MLSRRGLLAGLGAALTAPAIVRPSILMPISVERVWGIATFHMSNPWCVDGLPPPEIEEWVLTSYKKHVFNRIGAPAVPAMGWTKGDRRYALGFRSKGEAQRLLNEGYAMHPLAHVVRLG